MDVRRRNRGSLSLLAGILFILLIGCSQGGSYQLREWSGVEGELLQRLGVAHSLQFEVYLPWAEEKRVEWYIERYENGELEERALEGFFITKKEPYRGRGIFAILSSIEGPQTWLVSFPGILQKEAVTLPQGSIYGWRFNPKSEVERKEAVLIGAGVYGDRIRGNLEEVFGGHHGAFEELLKNDHVYLLWLEAH